MPCPSVQLDCILTVSLAPALFRFLILFDLWFWLLLLHFQLALAIVQAACTRFADWRALRRDLPSSNEPRKSEELQLSAARSCEGLFKLLGIVFAESGGWCHESHSNGNPKTHHRHQNGAPKRTTGTKMEPQNGPPGSPKKGSKNKPMVEDKVKAVQRHARGRQRTCKNMPAEDKGVQKQARGRHRDSKNMPAQDKGVPKTCLWKTRGVQKQARAKKERPKTGLRKIKRVQSRPAEEKGSPKTGPESKNRPASGNLCPSHPQTPSWISKG